MLAARLSAAFLLPYLIVDFICDDERIASLATGGEWLRLNASDPACFGFVPIDDRYCRHTTRADCLSNGACAWASPTRARCAGGSHCQSRIRLTCELAAGCNMKTPLDLRLACKDQSPTSVTGGRRCEAFRTNESLALVQLRDEVRANLTLVFAFLVGNYALLCWYGGFDAVVNSGRPAFFGFFILTALASHIRKSFAEHGELRWTL